MKWCVHNDNKLQIIDGSHRKKTPGNINVNVNDLHRMGALINSVWSSAYETQQKVVQTDAVIINLLNVQTRFLIFLSNLQTFALI